ncbi:hypothetical protein ACWEQ4_00840 [Rhodococcus sp. NPDC003994]
MSIAAGLAELPIHRTKPCGVGRWISDAAPADAAAIADWITDGKPRVVLHRYLAEHHGFPYTISALNIHARGQCRCTPSTTAAAAA